MRVLLIDDNKDINDMVCMCLEGQDILCRIIEEGKAGKQQEFSENPYQLTI